jgi:TIR domain
LKDPMSRVFISYRRSDSGRYAARLYKKLTQILGRNEVFLDVGEIAPAERFPAQIGNALRDCDLLVLIIGRTWLSMKNKMRSQKLSDHKDWVRQEITLAQQYKIPILPLLIGGATPLVKKQLPRPLTFLAEIQARDTKRKSLNVIAEEVENALPRIKVEFETDSRKEPLTEPDFVIHFSVENAPPWAKWVRYYLDEDNDQPTRLWPIGDSDWTTTWGDYELSATLLDNRPLKARRKRLIPPVLVSRALRKTYAPLNDPAIRRAIREIAENE